MAGSCPSLLTIQKGSAKTVRHRYKIIIGHFCSVQVDHTIVEIDIRTLQDACLIDPKATIDHQNKDISSSLTCLLVTGVFDR